MTPIIFKAANHFCFLMAFKYVYEMFLFINSCNRYVPSTWCGLLKAMIHLYYPVECSTFFSPQFLFKAVLALVGVEAPPCLETTRRHPHRRSNRPGSWSSQIGPPQAHPYCRFPANNHILFCLYGDSGIPDKQSLLGTVAFNLLRLPLFAHFPKKLERIMP